MKNRIGIIALFLFAVSFSGIVKAEDPAVESVAEHAPEGEAAYAAEQVKTWKKAAQPSEGHQVLEGLAGIWTYEMSWWKDPSAEPQTSAGATTNTWILGGRFLKQETKGEHMGELFEGLGFTGYDNMKQKYTGVWMDNMSTSSAISEGSYDAATKTMTETGQFSCPMAGKEMTFRSEWILSDADHYTYSMYTKTPEGQEFKSLSISYTRQV